MQQQDTVMSLKAELVRAMDEIKALKDGTSSLKEQVEQLQEQLREKDCLLKKETRKRRNRFRAYVTCLYELTECQAKCGRLEASLQQEPPETKTSWSREMEVEEENQVLKEEVDLLKVGHRKLEDELIHKNQLIVNESKKRKACTNAYIDCLALLTATEQEQKKSLKEVDEIKALKDITSSLKEQVEQLQEQLREKDGLVKKETRKRDNRFRAYVTCLDELTECQAKCGRLEASLHQEPPQPETSWSREVKVEKENQVLKEEVALLKVGQRKLEDELIHKNQLIESATQKKIAQTHAYIHCLALLMAKEKELKNSRAETLEVKPQQTRSERLSCREVETEMSWSREEEPDKENQALKEEVDLLKVGQRRQEVKLQQTRSERLSCREVEAETSWSREEEVDKENQALKEEVNHLKVGQRKLEYELIHKNQLIECATKKKSAQTNAYIHCLALLMAKEKGLKNSRAETLEVKLQQTRSERLSCREVETEMSWSREEEPDKENQALKEEVDLLKVGQRRQEVKLQQTRSERLSCREVEAETSWSREEEVDKENQALKEQVKNQDKLLSHHM